MNTEVSERKTILRREIRAATAAVRADDWKLLSQRACEILRDRSEWTRAVRVLFYYPVQGEIDLRPVMREALAAGRLVALPRYRAQERDFEAALIEDETRDIHTGWAGIPEPRPECASTALNQLDFVFVPGVGFDLDGRRLGRGKGFYDRLLMTVRGIRCGVACEWQLAGYVPTEPHDEPVDCILTPARWIGCHPRAV